MSTDEEKKSPGSGCSGHKEGAVSTDDKKTPPPGSEETNGKKPGGSG